MLIELGLKVSFVNYDLGVSHYLKSATKCHKVPRKAANINNGEKRAKGRLMLIEPPHDACSHLDKNVR